MSRSRISLPFMISCGLVLLLLAVVSTHAMVLPTSTDMPSGGPSTTESLGGKERYLTFISTDKPIYRSGEMVYARGVMLDGADHKPMHEGTNINTRIQIRDPKGIVVGTGNTSTRDSVWSYAWQVPSGQSGGEYTLSAAYSWHAFPPAERKFDVRAYRAPRLNSQITFLRDGYGPGEHVSATIEVKRAEGGIPEGTKVSFNARVDGTAVKDGAVTIDSKGLCTVSFDLPREIARGEGALTITAEDGGVIESNSKTIPILLKTVDIQMYPEGGDLVAGFKNRVYVQAFQTNGKPADITADIISDPSDKQKTATAKFHTEHEGRGRFTFTPDSKHHYFLRISKPDGIKKVYPLPTVKSQGAIIIADEDVYRKDTPVALQFGCTQKEFRVTVAKREIELVSLNVDQSPKGIYKPGILNRITLPLATDVDGVLRVTAWDKNGKPLTERLIFREPAKHLNISIRPDKQSYLPGDNAKVVVKATDANGKPVSAVCSITVTDDSVLKLVDKRERAPRLPVMFYLEPEVKDLADAHVYLDQNNSKAHLATDLLLGTQGWRRFSFMNVEKFLKDYGDLAKRVLASSGKTPANFQLRGGAYSTATPSISIYGQPRFFLPEEIGRVEGPRDTNLFSVEPTVIDERHYTSGRVERQQRNSAVLPEGSPIPDVGDGAIADQSTGVIAVREFALRNPQDRKQDDRKNFAETVFWNADVKTDEKTGEGTVNFGLSDSITTFEIITDAFSTNGSLGASTLDVKSVKPFYAEAKLPLEVSTGDRVLLPINLVNGTTKNLEGSDVSIDLPGPFKLLTMLNHHSEIRAGERTRCLQPIDVGFGKGLMQLVVNAKAGSYQDKVTRQIAIKPKGFPIEKSFGGVIEPGEKLHLKVAVEKRLVPDSITSETAIYPAPLANLTKALERMIQEPNGCFEQTSSTSYPLTMAQQYFQSHTGVDPKLIEQSRVKLDAGYKKLLAFWCPDRGYEWYGENPGHEALTAFGLLHFNDMAKVRNVDQNMVATTRSWLLKQKDGKGGFTRKRRSLHTWIEDGDCSNAYIVWALLETGQKREDLTLELDSLRAAADASKNSYVVALAANAFALSGDRLEAKKLMHRLAEKQKTDGSIDSITSSIVGSGGDSLQIEGTALATLAWMRDNEFAGNVEKSMKFLADSCKDGRYGSTQATVLALRAIVTYDKLHSGPKNPGKLRLLADGQPVGDWITFDKSNQEPIKLPNLTAQLTPGDHDIEIEMEGGNIMPYSLAVKYNSLTPQSDKNCKLSLTAKMAQEKVMEGTSTEANVIVENKTKEALPTPIAIIGLPGGLEPRHDQLKELVKRGTIDSYEVRGSEVVLYWRAIAANAKVHVPLSLIAAIPGTYTGTASRAYLYYTDELKDWANGLHVDITAKN